MELDGALLGLGNLVYGVGDTRLLYVGFVGCIIHDDAVVLDGIIHPPLELLLGDDGTCGVVGVAQIDDIHPLVG